MKIEEQVLSREQMAHLEELGIDTSDASMAWLVCKDTVFEKKYLSSGAGFKRSIRKIGARQSEYIPTYTIGDIIDKLPTEIGDYSLMIFVGSNTVSYTSFAAYSLDDDMVAFDYNGGTLKNALYNLLCWVAENHKELIK